MISEPHIPKFQNGEFLTEAELYHLAWLPLELYRLNNLAKNQLGFFCPDTKAETPWNHLEQAYDSLTVHSLFVISPEGIPFILTQAQRLELSEVTIDRTTLFASAYFANHSKAFEDATFAPESYDEEGQPIANAYQVVLHWGEDTAPDIPGTTRYKAEVGRMTGVDSADFRVTPLAYNPSGLPELHTVTQTLATALEGYTQLILEPALAPSVDRSSLLDRLEQLTASLTKSFTPTQKSVTEAQLMMKAAKGFYLRLAYTKDAQNPIYQSCKGLTRRVLEHQLESLYESRDALGDAISSLTQHITFTPATGYEQLEFFRGLEALFDITRNTELFESWRMAERKPEAPRQRQEPGGPRIIDLHKKNS
jgi:hypothetical protein